MESERVKNLKKNYAAAMSAFKIKQIENTSDDSSTPNGFAEL